MNRVFATFSILIIGMSNALYAAFPSETANKSVILRIEKVGPEALGLAAEADGGTYVRVVAKAGNGRFLVAVRSNVGILRMQGAYLDSALVVEDGVFTYYHPNGREESNGRYQAGIKTGTWVRFGVDGQELSERVYTGHSVDELSQGTVANLPTAVVPEVVRPAVDSDRRESIPMQF